MRSVNGLPHFAKGTIVKGFGRGSKELGIPTANFPLEVVKTLPKDIEKGVYFGWASVSNGPVYKMVMSIGWNPFYNNTEKSMETHIIHNFNRDLYGLQLKVCILGYIRPELNFNSLQQLIEAINNDITTAKNLLDQESYLIYKSDNYFNTTEND